MRKLNHFRACSPLTSQTKTSFTCKLIDWFKSKGNVRGHCIAPWGSETKSLKYFLAVKNWNQQKLLNKLICNNYCKKNSEHFQFLENEEQNLFLARFLVYALPKVENLI